MPWFDGFTPGATRRLTCHFADHASRTLPQLFNAERSDVFASSARVRIDRFAAIAGIRQLLAKMTIG